MVLPLPILDDMTFHALVEEARRVAVDVDPRWTDHNPADPGMTLVELFAWLTDMLLYRLDQVTDDHRRTFLRLIEGPTWRPDPGLPLDEQIRKTLAGLRHSDRAVTERDFERIARRTSPEVIDARCLPETNLESDRGNRWRGHWGGHVSVVVLSRHDWPIGVGADPRQPPLYTQVKTELDRHRPLCMHPHVVGPRFSPIRAQITVLSAGTAADAVLKRTIATQLNDRLAPKRAGLIGKPVSVADIERVVAAVPGVARVDDITPTLVEAAKGCGVTAEPIRDGSGALLELRLKPDAVPCPRFEADDITIRSPAPYSSQVSS